MSHTGGLGANIQVSNEEARYIRVEGHGRADSYFGLGEIEVYSKAMHPSPMMSATQVSNSDSINIEYTAPGSAEVVILRRKFKDEHVKQRFAYNRFDGTEIARITKSFGSSSHDYVDTDVTAGERYYYTVFARSATLGWNLVDYKGCDSTVSGTPNPNLAVGKFVRGSHEERVTWGSPDFVTDGTSSSLSSLCVHS